MNKLIIDTTDTNNTLIRLETNDFKDEIKSERQTRSQDALIIIEKILKKNNINSSEIDEIEVNSGPGSFTGTRVGVAIANALGFGLDIKVNGSKIKQVTPRYV